MALVGSLSREAFESFLGISCDFLIVLGDDPKAVEVTLLSMTEAGHFHSY